MDHDCGYGTRSLLGTAAVHLSRGGRHRWCAAIQLCTRGHEAAATRGIDGTQYRSDALITTTSTGRGAVVPFIGLAEAHVLAGFRAAGVPMQRIRPALEHLENEIGVVAALTSERLKTDGAEMFWDYGRH
ncbi:hypothetical protein [Pseudactinotalea sp. Z1732]|uniref:hypothetical protein n=1 Tax=Pseudactinotalea sp. Z1732 TaxID=3413026 RepID=UPI003C7D48E6